MTQHRRINLIYAAVFAIIMIAAWCAHSQTTVPAAKPDAPKDAVKHVVPTVSDAEKLKFFKAQAEMETAQGAAREATSALQQKTVALQSVVSEIATTCGKEYLPYMDKSGDPACVLKTPEPKK